MRIIYVTSTLPHGPGEPFVIPEIVELMRRGHQILVVPMNPSSPVVHEDAGLILPHTVSRSLVSPEVLARACVTAARRPAQCAGVLGDILRSRNLAIRLKNLAVLPKALWLADLARTWDADHIHAHWAACTATIAYGASAISSVPWSLTTHRWDIGENNLLKVKAASARFVRAINTNGVDDLQDIVNDAQFAPVKIHMGVQMPCRRDRIQRTGRARGLMAANLVEVKGHRYLLQAMENLASDGVDVSLDLAGSGPLRPELERMIADLGLSQHVRLLGQISHTELIDQLNDGRWDFVVLSSIITADGEHEGTPVILMEAMSCGIPVISTMTGGIPDLLGDGAGVLVPDKDATALAGAIRRVAEDPALRDALGEAGRERVATSYSVTRVVDELERYFGCPKPARAEVRTVADRTL